MKRQPWDRPTDYYYACSYCNRPVGIERTGAYHLNKGDAIACLIAIAEVLNK